MAQTCPNYLHQKSKIQLNSLAPKNRHTEVVHVVDDLPWKSSRPSKIIVPWIVNYKSLSKIMVFSKRRFNNLMVFWSLDPQSLFPLQTPPVPVGELLGKMDLVTRSRM